MFIECRAHGAQRKIGVSILTIALGAAVLLLLPLHSLHVTPSSSRLLSYTMASMALLIMCTTAFKVYSRVSSRILVGFGGLLMGLLWFINRVVT